MHDGPLHGCSVRMLTASTAVQVPKQLREPFLEAVRAGRIRSMQNKLMPAAPIHTPGALLLGDAFNMRHPLTGTDNFLVPQLVKLHLLPLVPLTPTCTLLLLCSMLCS